MLIEGKPLTENAHCRASWRGRRVGTRTSSKATRLKAEQSSFTYGKTDDVVRAEQRRSHIRTSLWQGAPRWLYLLVPISALLVAAAALAWRAAPAQRQLAGATVFEDRQPAPDFALTDQFGRHTSLSEFHGRPVALTFIYTHCPDVCPLIASNMHAAHRQLGSQASQVALLAVTVDPENDTVDQIRAFSDQRRMSDEWHFMTGARDQLEPIWKNYGIYAQPSDSTGQPVAPAAQTVRQGTPPTPDQVEHSAPVYLIDRNGIERGTLPNDFTADMLSQDLQVLLNGG